MDGVEGEGEEGEEGKGDDSEAAGRTSASDAAVRIGIISSGGGEASKPPSRGLVVRLTLVCPLAPDPALASFRWDLGARDAGAYL